MKDRKDLYISYSLESSRGLFGYVLSAGHKKLERRYRKFKVKSKNAPIRILEIGGARNPHFSWIKNDLNISEYCIEDVDILEVTNARFPTQVRGIGFWTDDPAQKELFDRIVVCHVWEHIINPERALEKWLGLLSPKGVISILLPNDPAILWGFARRGYFLKLKKQGWKDLKEYKYALALEHVNSIQNLVRIAEFFGIKYPTEISMWPLGGKIISGNMQTVVSIRK